MLNFKLTYVEPELSQIILLRVQSMDLLVQFNKKHIVEAHKFYSCNSNPYLPVHETAKIILPLYMPVGFQHKPVPRR
jgi:hypothetical protein